MNLFVNNSGRRVGINFTPLLAAAGMLILLGGCAAVDTMTGKSEVVAEKSIIEQQLAASATRVKALEKEKSELEKKLADAEEQLTRKEAEFKAAIEKLEKSSKGGMSIVLFGGDIIYKVDAEGFTNYRAGLRYRTLRDTVFATALGEFERGQGGDADMIKVLKEIDTSGDRFIDSNEAARFRKAEEDKYSQM